MVWFVLSLTSVASVCATKAIYDWIISASGTTNQIVFPKNISQMYVIVYHKPNTNQAAAVQTPWYMLVQGSPTIHNTLCVTVRDPQSVKGLNVWQHLYWDRFIFMRRQFVTGIQWHEIIRRLKIYALVKRWVSLDIQVQIIWRIKMQLSDWYVEFVLKKSCLK